MQYRYIFDIIFCSCIISRHSAPHLIRVCSGGLHRTTKTLVPPHCYKPACDLVKWILLKYNNKRDLLFVTKLSISVLLSKHSFKFRTALINGLIGQTLFLSKLGQKPSNAGRPPFSPHYL